MTVTQLGTNSQDLNQSLSDGKTDALNHSLHCPVSEPWRAELVLAGFGHLQPSPYVHAWSRLNMETS